MMKVCQLCDKKTTIGIDSTHKYGGGWARRAKRMPRAWKPNLRKAKIKLPDGTIKKMIVCMKCYKKASLVG